MGKIIRNGIEFSSTVDTANNISYDNSLSGLEATTTQKAIDEVADNVSTLNESLKIVDVTFSAPLGINEKGYASGASYIPSISGYKVIHSSIFTWGSGGTPYGITSTGAYVIGQPSTTIEGLVVRYYLIKDSLNTK